MSELSLRAYGREIDELIERERLDEAIAHCRFILQTYSKHLETYRLLGKAYLEAKRYGDAADIFQRVLSAVPDDFVSHVGMAIVREDEGNLDASIWHMERAFETNPSNPAIQQEMKRLISRRDGLEPHKVRLTRGALARMYAHGELFAQAIAELRSALQEDAERPDLQVLLANMYWQTDQRSDAITISNQILEKLPYCAEANRILAANLQANDRAEEAAVYHRRLANLDPYAAFVESALADANSVEDSAVSLEKLDWVAGEPLPSTATGQPGWAATLGMEMQGPGEDVSEKTKPPQTGPLPSWLEPGEPPAFEASAEKELRQEMDLQAEDTSEGASGAGFLAELEAEISDQADLFKPEPESEGGGPDRSGLTASDGLATAVPSSETEDGSEEAIEGEVAEPVAGMFDQAQDSESSADGFELADEEPLGEDAEPGSEALPTGEAVENGPTAEAAEGDIPSWMQEAGWKESSGEVEEAPVSFSDQDFAALESGQVPTESAEAVGEELAPAELPDWIHDIAPEEVEGSSDGVADEGLPSWIQSPAAEEPADDVVAASAESEATELNEEGEVSFPSAEADTSGLPTWISDDLPGATETIVTWLEDRGPDSSEGDVAEGDELPDWMRDTGPLQDSLDPGTVVSEEVASSPEPVIEEPATELPEEPPPEGPSSENWLSAVAAAAAEEEAEPSSSKPGATQTPDWLSEAMEVPEDSTAPEVETESDQAISADVATPSDEEKAESLSPGTSSPGQDAASPDVDFGLEEETEIGISSEEESREQPGISEEPEAELVEQDTLEAAAAGEGDPSFAAAAETVASDEPSADSSAPDWLEEIGTLPKQPVETDSAEWLEGLEIEDEETAAAPASETPEWLRGLADEGAEGEASGATSAPDWLREIGEPGSVGDESDAADAQPEEELAQEPVAEEAGGAPDWLPGVGSVADEETPDDVEQIPAVEEREAEPEIPQVGVEEDDEVMDWLEDLAAKQAQAPEEGELEITSEEAPATPVLEDRDIPDEPEEGLEWLEQLADQRGMDIDVGLPGQAAAEASAPEPEAEPELDTAPGWLGRMATQPLPKVDMEALEAAAKGEGIDPDAETVEAQAPDFKAQLEEFTRARQVEKEAAAEAAPDDVTIEARAGDLQKQMEAAEREAKTVEEAAGDVDSEDAIPDWLIAAAEQSEAPVEPPSGMPEEFSEEPESEPEDRQAEPTLPGEREYPTEPSVPSPAETVPATSETISEVDESAIDIPTSALSATEGEKVQQLEPEPPVEKEAAEPGESVELQPPAVGAGAQPSEPVEAEPSVVPDAAEPIEPVESEPPAMAEAVAPVEAEPSVVPDAAEPIESVESEPPAMAEAVAPVEAEPPTVPEASEPVEPVEAAPPAVGEAVAPIEAEPPTVPKAADPIEPVEAAPPAVTEPTEPAELAGAESERVLEQAPGPEVKGRDDSLERSRQALAAGDTQIAVELYGDLIKRKKSLESVIEDLRIAVDRTPDDPDLWQILGDAYMRDDRTDEAINAYRKGMETA